MTRIAAGPDGHSGEVDVRTSERRERSVLLTLLGAVVLVFVISIVRAARSSWHPSSDMAFMLLRADDVGTRGTPLLGVYSRFGWNHPGPLQLWWLGPASSWFGPTGMLVWTAVANAGWIAGTVAAARRLGGTAMAIGATAISILLVASAGDVFVTNPWNPWVVPLAVLCFTLNAVTFAETGRWPYGLVALVAGSWAVQSHIGSAPVVAAGGVAAAAWFLWVRPALPRLRNLLAGTFAAIVALWSGPILDQFFGTGNLGHLTRFVVEGSGETRAPTRTALGVAAKQLGPTPPWLGFSESRGFGMLEGPLWTLALVPVALCVLGVVAWRRRDLLVVRCCGLALVLHAATTGAVLVTTGGLLPYVLRWAWVAGAVAGLVLAWGVWRTLTGRGTSAPAVTGGVDAATAEEDDDIFVAEPAVVLTETEVRPSRGADASWGQRAIAGVTALILLGVAVQAGRAIDHAVTKPVMPEPELSIRIGATADAVSRELAPGRYNANWAGTGDPFGAVQYGVFVELERHGFDLRFDQSIGHGVGTRRAGFDPRLPTLAIAGADPFWVAPADWKQVASWTDTSDPTWETRADELRATILDELGLPPDARLTSDQVADLGEGPAAAAWYALQAMYANHRYIAYLVPAAESESG